MIFVSEYCHVSAFRQDIPFVRMVGGKPCPDGTDITNKERCEEALKHASSLGIDGNKNIVEGGFALHPLKCSVGTDLRINPDHVGRLVFNSLTNRTDKSNDRLNNGEVEMICESGKLCTLPIYSLKRIH